MRLMQIKSVLEFVLILIALAVSNCGSRSLPEKKVLLHMPLIDTASNRRSEERGNPIDYNTKVLSNVYVTVRDGIDSQERPNQSSGSVIRFEYGAKLEVIEIIGEWLGVRERILRKFIRNGSHIESTGWEKVYVPKNATGNLNDISLLEKDLNIIATLTLKGKTFGYEEGEILTDYLKIDLIDKSIFDLKKTSAVNFLLADTTVIYKKNGVIELPTAKGLKKFTDKPDAETEMQEFAYVGQVKFLNSYVLQGIYWENWDYKFINKTTGKQETSFVSYPHISPDKEHILCISGNPYSNTADLELYTIRNNKVKIVMAASFINWMPINDIHTTFFSNDGFLYVQVLPMSTYWNANEGSNIESQYIRIKIFPQNK